WWTEGVYISFNLDVSDPSGWSAPQRLPLEIVSPYLAYPQVIGLEADGTDKVAGQGGRVFLLGRACLGSVFERPLPPPPPPTQDKKGRGPPPRTPPPCHPSPLNAAA